MKLRLIFALLLLTAALSTSWHPAGAFVAGYVCRGSFTTPAVTGYGSTCTSAHSDLVTDLRNAAETDCDSVPYADHACAVTSITDTAACSCSGGLCQETAYGTHACAECGYPGGPICP
jgi:hypothetical protein